MSIVAHSRSALVGAVSLMFSLLPSVSLALGPDCIAPGSTLLTDAVGDQVGNTDTDIHSVSISEASSTTRNLVFTVKTGLSQGMMSPNARWIVTFKANTPAKDYYVSMATGPETNGGKPVFHYGTGISGFGGTDSLGRGLAGSSYDALTGTIRIVAPNTAFAVNAGNSLNTIAAAVRLSGGACGVACVNGAAADTGTSTLTYQVGAACGSLEVDTGSSGINKSAPGLVYGGRDFDRVLDSRFQVFEPPAGIGADGSGGEYSIGYNPETKRIMANSMGFSPGGVVSIELFSAKVFRITPPEQRTPVLVESCDAQWEDKSNLYNSAFPQVLSDPILWTDQDTGRTFSANLTVGPNPGSAYAYTDDDGDNWIHGGTGIAGADHQTIVSGFYPPNSPFEVVARTAGYGQKNTAGTVTKGKAVYFCSQDLVPGSCVRSDDGGNSWSAPQVAYDGSVCSNLHGHLKIALDGSAYLPIKGCGAQQGGTYTHNAGLSWTQFTVPNTAPQADGSDPSIAIDDAGKLYYCYVNGDGRARVRVGSKNADGSLAWNGPDTDLGSAHGIRNASFPEAIGGDSGRASCGFLGTNDPSTNYQSRDFDGVWYLYIATTTDGGASWTTVNATPNDPVQGVGGIWQQGGSGDTNNNRNLLDFNEVTMDEKGRVLFGYNDGCVGACNTDPVGAVTYVASMRVARQTGGKTLRAAFDDSLGVARAPGQACFSGNDEGANVRLEWKRPDNGGAALRYDIEEVFSNGTTMKVGETSNQSFSVSSRTLASSAYLVRAVNSTGGTASKVLGVPATPVVVKRAPTSSLTASPSAINEGDEVTFTVTLADLDGDALQYELDFGDGSAKVTGNASGTVPHTYLQTGNQLYTATLKVREATTTPPLSAPDVSASITQTAGTGGGGDPAITITSFTASPNSGDVTNGPLNVTFSVAAADTDPNKGTLSYTYYYGDGTHSARLTSSTSSHSYEKAGSYHPTVIVADDNANSATAETTVTTTTTVTVNPSAPVTAVLSATLANNSSQVPATAILDGSGSTSYSGAVYRFNFGDGTAQQVGTAKMARHVYTLAGSYTVTLTVTDKDDPSNTSTATATVNITAAQQTVAQLSISPSTTTVGQQVSFDASASIAKSGSSITSYTFDFGDGTTPLLQNVTSPDDGSAAKAKHIYTRAGSFTPSVTVTDSSAGSSAAKADVKVTAPKPAPAPAPAEPVTPTPLEPVLVNAGGGGGALPLWSLLPLLMLAGLRRRRR